MTLDPRPELHHAASKVEMEIAHPLPGRRGPEMPGDSAGAPLEAAASGAARGGPLTGERDPITLAQAQQRLRQERELFDRRMAQNQHTFRLMLATGWTTIVLFVAICAFCGYVIVKTEAFSTGTVTAATSALLVEVLALIGVILKGTMGGIPREVEPTTAQPPPSTTE